MVRNEEADKMDCETILCQELVCARALRERLRSRHVERTPNARTPAHEEAEQRSLELLDQFARRAIIPLLHNLSLPNLSLYRCAIIS
jgi:hypothetical protein